MGCMTKAEVTKLLTIIAAMYPRFEISTLKVELWLDMIGDIPFKEAQMAVKKVMMTSEFPPTVAEIRKAATDITTNKGDVLDAGKAWGEVMLAIRKYGSWSPEEAYSIMSPATAKIVKQIGWQEICSSEVIEVVRGQFMKMFDSYKVREQQDRLLPTDFKSQIELIANNFNMIEAPEDNNGR